MRVALKTFIVHSATNQLSFGLNQATYQPGKLILLPELIGHVIR